MKLKYKALILVVAFVGGASELKAQNYGYQYGQPYGGTFNWDHQSGHTTHEQWNRGPTNIPPSSRTYVPVAPAYRGSQIPTDNYYGDQYNWRSDY